MEIREYFSSPEPVIYHTCKAKKIKQIKQHRMVKDGTDDNKTWIEIA